MYGIVHFVFSFQEKNYPKVKKIKLNVYSELGTMGAHFVEARARRILAVSL